MPVDTLINELLASGSMNEDTTAELNRMLAEYQAGNLHPDDADYIRALHARLNDAPLPEPEPLAGPVTLDGLSIEQWRDRALAAETELQTVREQIAAAAAQT